jgi:hypothetical protein
MGAEALILGWFIMNWRSSWWFSGLRNAALVIIAIAVALVLPSPRSWVLAQLQAHPLRGALILAMLCFVAAYLVAVNRPATANRSASYRDAGLILAIIVAFLAVGLFFTGALFTVSSLDIRPGALRCAMLWASACFMIGFLAGFLFGVPRFVDNGAGAQTGSSGSGPGFAQRPNTNLEQISDWLTKIIVGLGLVELKGIPPHLRNAAQWVAESISTATPPSQPAISFAGSLIIYFTIVGFLAGYLLTLLFLAGAFGRAGQQAYGSVGSYGVDDASAKIRNYWRPNNAAPDPQNERNLIQWINTNLPEGTSIADLINTKEFDQARKKVVADLRIS